MKRRSKISRKRKVAKQDMLTGVARTIGSTMGTIAATAERLGEKSRAIASQAGTLTRKARKRLPSVTSISSATKRRARTTKRKSR